MKHFLNISEIASYTGFNTYDPVSAFDRFVKRYDSDDYTKCIEKMKTDIEKKQTDVKKLADEIQKSKELGIDTAKLERKVEKVKNDISNTHIEINKTIRKEVVIKETLGEDTLKTIEKLDNIEDKKKVLQEKIMKMDITKIEKTQLIKDTETFVNTDYGTKTEDTAIEKYEKRYKVKLDVSQKYNCRPIRENWFIGGKVDGLYIDESDPSKSYIVEIKNRARGFFNGLRDYEKVQVQLYMWMLGHKMTHLVECHGGKQRTTKIYYDDNFVDNILAKLDIFINKFLYFKEQDFDYKLKYVSYKNSQKLNFIHNLYLTDVSKVDFTDDLDSDTDECMLSSL